MSSRSLRDIERRARRQVIARSIGKMVLGSAFMLGVYVLLPVESLGEVGVFAWLALGLTLVTVAVVWQIRLILRADYPELQAIEGVVFTVTVFVVVFSLVYLTLSSAKPGSFTEELDRVSALYYTTSILSTVGFGDISARTDVARGVATLQMLLDLTLIALIARVILGVGRASLKRGGDS
jgi:hypothetical protein